MTLTPGQQAARDLARQTRDQLRDSAAPVQLRLDLALAALDALLAALDDDEEPVPPALIQAAKDLFTRPVADHRPGGCECGGHVQVNSLHDVQFVAAVAS